MESLLTTSINSRHSCYYNGQWYIGNADLFSSFTPDNASKAWEKSSCSFEQVNQAVLAATSAFSSWRQTAFNIRCDLLRKYALALKEHSTELSSAIQLETGKPDWEAEAEVVAMINKIEISIAAYNERTGEKNFEHLQLRHRAHGVMAVLGPFNFPGHLPNGHIVPALLAGNTCVFKPSEFTPLVGELMLRIWEGIHPPPGLINLVQGKADIGKALLNCNIQGVLFTGASHTGKNIHAHFGGKPEVLLALEMGGNNPFIVSDIEDSDAAALTILNSAFLSAGQRCSCSRRLILLEHDNSLHFLEKLISLCARVIVNTQENQQKKQVAFMGPVIHQNAATQIREAHNNLLSLGATPLLRLSSEEENVVYLRPSIIDVTGINNLPDEEIFGPILQVIRVPSFKKAIEEANRTRFGLAAGLLSDNKIEQNTFLENIRAGIVSINSPTAGASSQLPFGGVGASGNGRPSAYYAADYCAWPQAITHGISTYEQKHSINLDNVRGLK